MAADVDVGIHDDFSNGKLAFGEAKIYREAPFD